MTNPGRRDFLKVATMSLLSAAGLIGLGGLIRFMDYDSDPAARSVVDVGPASNYPVGSRTVLSDVPAVLLATPAGFKAISLVCTHLGCTVEQKAGGYECPCHGSRYNEQGDVTRGPARQALRLLRVEITAEGHVLLHLV